MPIKWRRYTVNDMIKKAMTGEDIKFLTALEDEIASTTYIEDEQYKKDIIALIEKYKKETPVEGKTASEEKAMPTQINSHTFSIQKESEEFKSIESVVEKIASDNKIDDVREIEISLDKESGFIKFVTLGEAYHDDVYSEKDTYEKPDAKYLH